MQGSLPAQLSAVQERLTAKQNEKSLTTRLSVPQRELETEN